MQYTTRNLLFALATTVLAAPIDNEKRQLSGESGLPSVSGISVPSLSGVALPTGGLGSSSGSGLGGLGSSSGGLGSSTGGLGALPSLGSSSGGLGGLGSSTGSGLDSESSGLSGLGGLGSSTGSGLGSTSSGLAGLGSSSSGLSGLDESTELTPTTTLKEKRQSLSGLGGLTTGSSSGLGSLGSGSSGLGSLPSGLGSLGSGTTGSLPSGLGSLGSGTSGLGSLESGSSSLGSLTGSTGTSTGSSSSTAASGGCKALTFIFARGTTETGTMGTVVGPPVASALANKLGADKVTSEGVDYPADAAGNANLGASGGPEMAKMAKSVLSSCPDSKVVLGGYSQGAMVVHNALSSQGLDGSKIAAVVAFGDPLQGQGFDGVDTSKVKEFCGSSDGICNAGGSDESGSHLSYGQDADKAATFIVQAAGLSASS